MAAGHILTYSTYEMKVELDCSVTGSWIDEAYGSAVLYSQYALGPLESNLELGFRCTATAVDGDDDSFWRWECPAISLDTTYTGSGFLSSMSVGFVLHDVRLYVVDSENGPVYQLRIDSIDLMREGAIHSTISTESVITGAWLAPAGIPLLGVPPTISGGAGVNPTPSDVLFDSGTDGGSTAEIHPATNGFLDAVTGEASDLEDVFAATTYCPCAKSGYHRTQTITGGTARGVQVDWVATGGWRLEAGIWHTPEVEVPASAWGGDECGTSYPAEPTMEAGTTWDAEVSGHYAYSEASTFRNWSGSGAAICLLPNLAKSVQRMEPDVYKALVVRYGLPRAQSVAAWACHELGAGAAYGADTSFSFPSLTGVVDNIPNLKMPAQHWAWYINTWASPHWHCFLWFPDDAAGGELTAFDWPVNGERATCNEYWGRIGQQWIEHPSLPTPKRTKTRVDILTEPVRWGSLTGLIKDTFVGNAATSWWGVSYFKTQTPLWAGSSTTDDTGWTITGATASHEEDSVVLTPTAEEVVVECDLTVDHWNRLAAGKILSAWSGEGITSGRAYLVGADGRELLLATESMSEAADRPRGKNRQFAGTWAQDYGAGFVEVIGEDQHKRGDSEGVASDADRLFQLQLPHAYGAEKMRWRFAVEGTDEITLDYPVFYPPEGDAMVLTETARFGPILYEESPGFRWGNLSWWNESGPSFVHPPLVRELGTPPTALDWMSWRRVVYEARAYNDGINAEIAATWDPNELTVPSQLVAQTSWFMAPIGAHGTAVLQNFHACVPPQPCLPWFARNTDLSLTNTLAQEAWSHCVEPRYYVEPEGFDMVSPGNSVWTEASSKEVEGWTIREHRNTTTGYELAEFSVRQRGRDWATTSPWHGAFASLRLHAQARGALDVHPSDIQLKMWIDEDREVHFGMRTAKEGAAFSDVATGLTGNCLAARWTLGDPAPFVWLLLADDTTLKLYQSKDFGETWTMAEELATGNALGAVALATARDATLYVYWIDGGEVKGSIRDPRLNERAAANPARADVEDEGLALTWFTRQAGQPHLAMLTVEEDAVVLTESVDGKVFE